MEPPHTALDASFFVCIIRRVVGADVGHVFYIYTVYDVCVMCVDGVALHPRCVCVSKRPCIWRFSRAVP